MYGPMPLGALVIERAEKATDFSPDSTRSEFNTFSGGTFYFNGSERSVRSRWFASCRVLRLLILSCPSVLCQLQIEHAWNPPQRPIVSSYALPHFLPSGAESARRSSGSFRSPLFSAWDGSSLATPTNSSLPTTISALALRWGASRLRSRPATASAIRSARLPGLLLGSRRYIRTSRRAFLWLSEFIPKFRLSFYLC